MTTEPLRITIVSLWYLPEPAHVGKDLAEGLTDLGHDVEVVTCFPSYPKGRVYPGYRIRKWQREVIDGVRVLRVPMFPDHSRSAVRRLMYYGSFALSATVLAPFLARRSDVVFVYHPPLTTALPGLVLSKVWKVPLVLQVQDMWPESLSATGMVDNAKVLGAVGALARRLYAATDHIFVISKGFKKNLVAKGVPSEHVSVISNPVDVNRFRPEETNEGARSEHGFTDRFVVMFAGNIGPAQDLDRVLDAAGELRHCAPEVLFAIVGDGTASENLKKRCDAEGLDNVTFLGRRHPDEMPGLFAAADALLVHLRDDPLFRITVPSKTLHYMASGKPILASVGGDTGEMIDEFECGVTVDPGDVDALVAATKHIASLSAAERVEMGDRGRRAAVEHLSQPKILGQLADQLAETVLARAGRS